MSGRMIDLCGPQRMKKKDRLRQINKNNHRESIDPGGQGEISVFPLTKLIMDVPNYENVDGIWTEDKHFSKQKIIKIYTTKDLLDK